MRTVIVASSSPDSPPRPSPASLMRAKHQVDIDFDAACRDRRFRAAVGAVRNYTCDNLYDAQRRQQNFRENFALSKGENAL